MLTQMTELLERGPDPATVDYLIEVERYQQLRYLSRGLFGHVVQALDKESGRTVSLHQCEGRC